MFLPQTIFGIVVCLSLLHHLHYQKLEHSRESTESFRNTNQNKAKVRDGETHVPCSPVGVTEVFAFITDVRSFKQTPRTLPSLETRYLWTGRCICLASCAFLPRRKGMGQNTLSNKQLPKVLGKRNWDRKQTVDSAPGNCLIR